MARHIQIVTEEHKQDNISIFHEGSVILVIADKDDLSSLNEFSECKRGGIYLLVGENKRYVGQSTDVYTRLTQHEKNKDWWYRVVIFTSSAGDLGKHQTDYLEKKLIESCQKEGLEMDNQTSGNTSFIDLPSKMKAENFWATSFGILEKVANIDVFEVVSVDEPDLYSEVQIFNNKVTTYAIIIKGQQPILGISARNVFVNFVTHILQTPEYREIIVVDGEPLSRHLGNQGKYVGTKKRIAPSGTRLTTSIEEGVELYIHMSVASIRKAIEKIAADIGFSVDIQF
ncbi:MAG: GIY-YIG nuclease family protein [Turicibacter sp.]|nr:GIY-YIG nuclease family protein [Turicibacter sp.]